MWSIGNSRLGRGFTPLHPESRGLKAADEWPIKFESIKKPQPLGRGVTGFTFVELMVTVVVVTVGLVFIIQGYITAAGALNSMQNRILAAEFLDSKMQELEIVAKYDKGIEKQEKHDEFSYEGREFKWELNIAPVEKEEELDLSQDLNTVNLKVSWVEKNIPKELSAATYLRNKK